MTWTTGPVCVPELRAPHPTRHAREPTAVWERQNHCCLGKAEPVQLVDRRSKIQGQRSLLRCVPACLSRSSTSGLLPQAAAAKA